MSTTEFQALLRPFDDKLCPACGGTCPTLRYCEHLCGPGIQGHGSDGFVSRTLTYQTGQLLFPHLHYKCPQCLYEWLAACRYSVPAIAP